MEDVIHTTVHRNGQWVTEPINLKDIMNRNATKAPEEKLLIKSPRCGIMTRTVIESPVTHWILPVSLRSAQHKDVAFVGDHYVQISELRRDGQLHSVIRKNDFGSRIRNAKVIGTVPDVTKAEGIPSTSNIKSEDGDVDMDFPDMSPPEHSTRSHQLPPQLLLVVLETGDCIFLFLRPGRNGHVEFVALRHETPNRRLVRPGFHMAVDPSSRYIALACARDLFIVYEVESMANLNYFYAHNKDLKPVTSFRPRTVNGVIHTMEFLYPRPEDPQHIILLLIVVKGGKSRMVTYDWELGNDLKEVLAEEKDGHRLPPEHEMPMLIIPLKIRTAFLAISPEAAAFCKDVLQGDPQFETCDTENWPTSRLHDGHEPPLWTTWARPQQPSVYQNILDHIYLAREDGVVMYMEFNAESILDSALNAGTFCNVSTAFASHYDGFNDVLILGGDSGPGSVWQLPPRASIIRLGGIPNWSPTVDFVTTDESATWNQEIGTEGNLLVPWKDRKATDFQKPSRIFATAGRGANGSIVEFRHGLQARIGLDLDCDAGSFIRRSFLLPASISNSSAPEGAHYLILSMPDRSTLLYLPPKFSSIEYLDAEDSTFDLSSPTILAVAVSEQKIAQVTETCIVFVGPENSARYSWTEALGREDITVTDASLRGDLLAITTHTDTQYELHILRLDAQEMKAAVLKNVSLQGDVTCLGIVPIGRKIYVVAGLHDANIQDRNQVLMGFHCVDDPLEMTETLKYFKNIAHWDPDKDLLYDAMEPLTSIVTVVEGLSKTVMVAGSRNGIIATLTFGSSLTESSLILDKISVGSAHAYPARDDSVFVCCDQGFFLLSDYQEGRKNRFTKKHNILLTDENDSSKSVSRIDMVTVLQESLSGNEANIPLLVLSDNHILLADLQPQAGPVPRHIGVGGTPHKLIYSQYLECLIVAVNHGDAPSLKFIDPDTGADLSSPSDKNRASVDFISGLGHSGDRIRDLTEWHYSKDDAIWYFVVVCTDEGRLLVVSTRRTGNQIRFWTRHKIKKDGKQPIYAATCYHDGLVFCAGTTVYYEFIDKVTKKLKPFRRFELSAPASALQMINEKIVALSSRDSIEILDPFAQAANGRMELVHADPTSRPGIHMMEVAGGGPYDQPGWNDDPHSSLILVCDRECGLAGLRVPWKEPGKDCEVMFEADLPASIRRFRRGRTMPGWLQAERRPKFGIMPSTADGAEILGMGIDGSLQHITLLKVEIWRLLRFIQNIAETSPAIYPFTYEEFDDDDDYDAEPKLDKSLEMQVDGDMLQRVLDQRALEGLMKSREGFVSRFGELMGEVDGGRWVEKLVGEMEEGKWGEQTEEEAYFDLGYEILEYYLVPVL